MTFSLGAAATPSTQVLSQRNMYVDGFPFYADHTGATDTTAAINLAITALGTNPGNLVFGGGTYKFGSLNPLQNAGGGAQGIIGGGSQVTFFVSTATGSNAAITVSLNGAFNGTQYGGQFSGFNLNGYSAGASAVGFMAGNLQGILMTDVQISGFGGAGMYLLNGSSQWTEQSSYQVRLIQNKVGVILDTGSFDYTNLDLTIVASANQTGVIVRNGAALQGENLRIRGNFAGGGTNTGAVVAIAPAGGADASYIKGGVVDIAVETTGSGVGHYTIYMNSTTSASQWFTQGTLVFLNTGGVNFQGVYNPQNLPFSHDGALSDTILGVQLNGEGGVCYGGFTQNVIGNLATQLYLGGLYIAFADIFAFQLGTGALSLTFQEISAYGRRMDLFIAQPAAGGPSTITWTGVKWAGGVAPTLSVIASRVDHIRMVYLPSQTSWYGELVGTNYA